MARLTSLLCFVVLLVMPVVAQSQSKPWTEWSKKEVEKILNDSAWGQTQTETNDKAQPTSTSAISTTTAGRGDANSATGGNSAQQSGANQQQAGFVKFRVRLLSAKPVRAAIAQTVNLQQPGPQTVEQMKPFVDRNFAEYIVVAVLMESNDRRFGGPFMAEIAKATAETFKTTAYLERKDGKRLTLMDYRAPINDGLGAKFIFPRMLDGKPFLDKDSGELHFVAETGKRIKLNTRFKVKDMVYDGQLEY